MITDIQLDYLKKILSGEIKIKDDPRKYSTYKARIREKIDHMNRNLLWLAKNMPELLSDLEYELSDETISMKRRAKALIKAVTLFENEPTVIEIISEIYAKHNIEVSHKR